MLAAVISMMMALCAASEPEFADVMIEKAFVPYLTSNPLLMEIPGAKVIRGMNGQNILLAVSSTVLKDDSSQEKLRAEKVCRIKALAGIVGETKGTQICHVEKLAEKTVVVIDGRTETATSVSELLQVTQLKIEGIVKGFPVVGRWRSKDRKVFYLAVGGVLKGDGTVVEQAE